MFHNVVGISSENRPGMPDHGNDQGEDARPPTASPFSFIGLAASASHDDLLRRFSRSEVGPARDTREATHNPAH